MRVVMIGPPGAGKGTQSVRLAEYLEIPHLSTGEILRAAKNAGSELGKIVAPIMDVGGLVDDDLMVNLIKERLSDEDCEDGYLLDGFPRTVPQAEAFQDFLEETEQAVNHVVEMQVDDEETTKRLIARFHEMKDPREDDRPEAIPVRLKAYHSETSPLIEFYSQEKFEGVLKPIDGIGTMDEVFQRIVHAITFSPS